MNEIPKSTLKSSPMTLKTYPLLDESPTCSPRSELYKNKDKDIKELRRRRSDTVVELRKRKKETISGQRRHISCYDDWSDNEDMVEEEEENQMSIKQIFEALKSRDISEIPAKYVRHLRHLTPRGRDPRSNEEKDLMGELMREEMIIKLINCIVSDECSMGLVYEVVALLGHLCSGDKVRTMVLVKCGIVNNLLALLSYDNFGVVEQSVLALTYIWNSCPEMAEMLNKTLFLNQLIGLIDSETSVSPSKYVAIDSRMGLVRALSWSLHVMTQSHDMASYRLSNALIKYFVKLLNYCDSEVKTNVLKALSATTERVVDMAENDNSPILKVVQSVVSNDSLFLSIIDYLSPNDDEVVLYSATIIGNIVSWGESYAQLVIQAKALLKFNVLLNHQNPRVQREAAFTVSNITAGNLAQIEAVIEANIIPPIVELLYMGDYRTQVEASHVMLNITAIGSVPQISYLLNIDKSIVNMDVIDAMAALLTSSDAKAIENVLKFYYNLLVLAKKAKVLDVVLKRCEISSTHYHIDSLQYHKNSSVAVLANHIIEEYFSQDVSLEEDGLLNASLGSEDDKKMDLNFSF